MKNIDPSYNTKKDQSLLDCISSLWSTREFQDAFDSKKGLIWDTVVNAMEYPIFFYNPSDPIERTHFTSFFRHIAVRHYDIPAVNDLYYLHELAHMGNMSENYKYYTNPNSFEKWKDHMCSNEFYASMVSEVFIYLEHPTLRAKTFDFEIWVDRFLKQGATNTRDWEVNLSNARLKVLSSQPSQPNDPIETYIREYNNHNIKWCDVWKSNFWKVNKQMVLFQTLWEGCNTDNTRGCCLDTLRYFLDNQSTHEVPFIWEAAEFRNYLGNSVKTSFIV